MRVVITGASGNVGTSVLHALASEPSVESVLGLCRRIPSTRFPKTEWRSADVTRSPLRAHFQDADAVIHLAWLIQLGRDKSVLREVNVDGSARVFRAAQAAGVQTLVYASSVGAYAKGPKDRLVDESWPTTGIPSSFYSCHKSEVERLLDGIQVESPGMRIVRLRPGLIFKRDAASEIRRLFAGPLLPNALVRTSLIPFVPAVDRLRFQAVHSHDVAEAYRLALTREVSGVFNIAAEPVLDAAALSRLLDARPIRLPGAMLRGGAALSYLMRLQPSEPGWVDMGLGVPLMDVTRARTELGWTPRRSGSDALLELLDGIREHAGMDTPPLESGGAGPLRVREFVSGVGARLG